MNQTKNTMNQTRNTLTRNEDTDIKSELQRKIRNLQVIVDNKKKLMQSARNSGDSTRVTRLQKEIHEADNRIVEYRYNLDSRTSNVSSVSKESDGIMSSVKNLLERTFSGHNNEKREPAHWPDTADLVYSQSVRTGHSLQSAEVGKGFPFIGDIRYCNPQGNKIEKKWFHCICRYEYSRELMYNQDGYRMVMVTVQNLSWQVLWRSVGYLDEEKFKNTGRFFVKSATGNALPICKGEQI